MVNEINPASSARFPWNETEVETVHPLLSCAASVTIAARRIIPVARLAVTGVRWPADGPVRVRTGQAGGRRHRRLRRVLEQVTVQELAAAIERGETVVDVRNPDEYAAGHVPTARSSSP